MIRDGILAILCLCLLAAFQCSDLPMAGKGGSSETTNAKVAFNDTTVVVISNDPTIKGLSLAVYSSGYRPYENYGYADSVTDSSSNTLQWNAPSQGDFCFLLKALPSGSATFLRDITIIHGMMDTIDCILGQCHDLTGYVEPEDSMTVAEKYALSIYGTPFYAVTDSLDRFAIPNVPSGSYTLSVRSLAKRLFINTVDYSIITDSLGAAANLQILLP